jgi:hypothetical protein
VIDVTDPGAPRIAGSASLLGQAVGVAVAGPNAYVATLACGLMVVDASDTAAPRMVGSLGTPDPARGVAVANGYVFIADESGLRLAPMQCGEPGPASVETGETAFDALRTFASPNPGPGWTDIRLEQRGSRWAKLGVYDTAGRLVRRVSGAGLAPGSWTVRWDGRDDAGRAVPAGVYSIRATTADGAASRRLVLIR